MNIFFRNLGVALILSAASVIANHLLGFNTARHDIGVFTRNAATVIFWCSIFVTVMQMREEAGAEHNFLSGFRNGFLYSVFFSGGFSTVMAFYQHKINPQFYPTYRAYYESKLVGLHLSPEQLAAKMRQFDMNYNGDFPTYALLFLAMGMGGAILAAIAAVIYRKPRRA